MKKITILGSTGSIGKQAVEIIQNHPQEFECFGLAAFSNLELLDQQIKQLKPKVVAVVEDSAAQKAQDAFQDKAFRLLLGQDGLLELAADNDSDLVLNAIVGAAGLRSTVSTIKARIDLALANKESMVIGGEIITRLLEKYQNNLIPVDSEHSALFQCLQSGKKKEVQRLLITGSGGPFRGWTLEQMKNVTVEEALKHPRWKMGPKITIDSATLANKGLEYIEAYFLFGIGYDRIEIIIHPQSIIHSMVEFVDGSIIAHLGQTDMRIPIQYAFSFPERISGLLPQVEFSKLDSLDFEKPDFDNFPCLKLCINAAQSGKTYPLVYNAANEEAVKFFLNKEIRFTDIPSIIYEVLTKHKSVIVDDDLEILLEVDKQARIDAGHIKNVLSN